MIHAGNTVKKFNYCFVPNMDGGNFIAQAYAHLKTLPEFAGASKQFVICDVAGNTLNVSAVIETTAAGQAVTAVNPTFVKTSNYS